MKLIKPHYPKAGKGRPAMPMETMLRIYFLQHWYALSDPAAEEALYDMESMRRFAGLELVEDDIPDETTLLNFRHLIENYDLSTTLFNDINAYLVTQGITVSTGSMVDATIIHAAASTKNKSGKRDPEMHSTRKNNQFYFGMKIHIGTDVNSNVIHTGTVTAANTADIDEMPKLLRETDEVVFGDSGYTSESYKRGARELVLQQCSFDEYRAIQSVQDKARVAGNGHSLAKTLNAVLDALGCSLRAIQKTVIHVVASFVKGTTIPFKTRLVANGFLNRCIHQNYVAGVLGISWKVNDKRRPKHTKSKKINLSNRQKKRNRKNSSVRARVEHCFRVIKSQFAYRKARYKGLEKNRVQVMTLLGLANLYMQRKRLAV